MCEFIRRERPAGEDGMVGDAGNSKKPLISKKRERRERTGFL
jgi:hypothetical protein